MEQLKALWNGLGTQRRLIVIGAVSFVFLGVLWIGRSAVNSDYALLYSGLDPAASGDVISALEQQGVPYRIAGGAIRVPIAQRDRLRMTLASEGLPANGASGYELLDSLSGFGTTSQMFDAAYWRAKEGELARTMTANPAIRAARVHISNQTSRPFQQAAHVSASVHVVPSGQGLSPEQARALRFLVSSAVAGLDAASVTVINGTTGQMIEGDDPDQMRLNSTDRAGQLKASLERLLEAHVGIGKAIVEVNVDVISDTETILERRFDPDERVAISSETTERESTSTGAASGAVSVASNLPDGDAAGGGQGAQSQDKEAQERVNYEVSETTREVVRAPGNIRRLSVAVLVDGTRDAETGQWAARSDDELAALEALVASAMGFDAARGDSITIKSLELNQPAPLPDLAVDSGWPAAGSLDATALVQLAVLALLVLVLAVFVIRPILLGNRNAAGQIGRLQPTTDALSDLGTAPDPLLRHGGAADDPANALPLGAAASPALPPLGAGQMPEMAVGDYDLPGQEPMLPPPPIPVDAEAVARLKALISERREETLEVLRGWMETVDDREGEGAR